MTVSKKEARTYTSSNLLRAGEKTAIGFLGAGALGALAPLQTGQLVVAITCVVAASACAVVLMSAAVVAHVIVARYTGKAPVKSLRSQHDQKSLSKPE